VVRPAPLERKRSSIHRSIARTIDSEEPSGSDGLTSRRKHDRKWVFAAAATSRYPREPTESRRCELMTAQCAAIRTGWTFAGAKHQTPYREPTYVGRRSRSKPIPSQRSDRSRTLTYTNRSSCPLPMDAPERTSAGAAFKSAATASVPPSTDPGESHTVVMPDSEKSAARGGL